MSVIDDYKIKHMTYSNIYEWHNAGYKGQGVNILNLEDEGTDHSEKSYNSVSWVAPESKIFRANIAFASNATEITKHQICDDGIYYDFEEYVKNNKIKIITYSMQGTVNPSASVKEYWKNLATKYNLIILNSAGNNGTSAMDAGTPFSFETAMQIGAVQLVDGVPKIASYSSSGEEVDFVNFTFAYSGTSFSCPYTAGECALIVSRYGLDMTFTECYKYLQFISKDLGDIGDDVKYGWGLPIMPSVKRKYIELILNSNNMQVDGAITLIDAPPVLDAKTSRTLVPLRVISESLGAVVTFDPTTQIAKLIKGSTTITIKVNSNIMYINGVAKTLDAIAQYNSTGNRLLVPVRAISEAFGCKVDWVQSTQKVMILEA